MRQIKFRAWDRVERRMFFPSSINFKGNTMWVCDSHGETKLEYETVEPAVELMQFTGLLDKNGKEIYEGDVVKCFDTAGGEVYDHPVELPLFFREIWSEETEEGRTKVEVIGNIYENPELIKN